MTTRVRTTARLVLVMAGEMGECVSVCEREREREREREVERNQSPPLSK